jgi:hypothetical protein
MSGIFAQPEEEEAKAFDLEAENDEEERVVVIHPEWFNGHPVRIHRQGQSEDAGLRAALGDFEDEAALMARLATYGPEQWATICESLLSQSIDGSSTTQQILLCFQYFYQLYCYKYQDEIDVIHRIRSIYPNIMDMKTQQSRMTGLFGAMQVEMTKRDILIEEEQSGRDIKRMLNRIAYNMKMTFENLVLSRLLISGNDLALRSILEEMTPDALFREPELGKLKKPQQLLHFYYRQAFKNGYRKDGDSIYKPRYNAQGDFTCSYEHVSDISDFVFNSVYPIEQNHYWFDCLTERAGTSTHCINMLTKVKAEWLPNLARNRMVHAFQNGVFLLDQNEFCWFRPPAGRLGVSQLSGNIVAVKYHDQLFDEEGMDREIQQDVDSRKTETPHYLSIDMGPVDRILADQEYTIEERLWIYAILGRLYFPIGMMDGWGVHPFFFGMAGTGKSTLLRLVATTHEPRDVGFLNNTLQKTFALEGIVDKLVYFALDIDGSFQLDQVTWQSMVVGEEVSVLRKFKTPVVVKWDIPGGFAANKMMNWTDNAGSLARRLIIIEFLHAIRSTDPNLFEKCLNMRDRFLKVVISAYHEKARLYHNRGIKEVLPQRFKDSEQKAILELNALMGFISEACDTETALEKTLWVNCQKFNKAFKEFCINKGIRPQPLVHDMITPVFSKFRIYKVEKPKATTDPFGQHESYYRGLKLRDSDG